MACVSYAPIRFGIWVVFPYKLFLFSSEPFGIVFVLSGIITVFLRPACRYSRRNMILSNVDIWLFLSLSSSYIIMKIIEIIIIITIIIIHLASLLLHCRSGFRIPEAATAPIDHRPVKSTGAQPAGGFPCLHAHHVYLEISSDSLRPLEMLAISTLLTVLT